MLLVSLSVPSSKVKQFLEDGTVMLSRNVGNESSKYPRVTPAKSEGLTTPRRKLISRT
jgi:hypothetical protein